MSESRPAYDVIIVGGGIAGLAAARELGWLGRKTVLLEGRDRFGGRAWTKGDRGQIVELGATWVHWMQPFVWTEISRHQLRVIDSPSPEFFVLPDGSGGLERLPTARANSRLEALLRRVLKPGADLLSRPGGWNTAEQALAEVDRMSVRERLDEVGLSSAERSLLRPLLMVLAGGPLETSAIAGLYHWWALAGGRLETLGDVLQRFRIAGGTGQLVDAIRADVAGECRLTTEVIALSQDIDKTEVVTREGGSFSARASIVAIYRSTSGRRSAFRPRLRSPGVRRRAVGCSRATDEKQ